MLPVVTPAEMAAIDAAAPEPVDMLIERAGRAVARAAIEMLGGCYGRRVVVIAGKGNNGNDGRAAAARLARRGVRVEIVDATDPGAIPACDLVIDAAYGTGFRGRWPAPDVGATPVLAVDIPSGVDGLTGSALGAVLAAERTVTFGALKPGLLFEPGRGLAGVVEVADIGLAIGAVTTQLVEAADIREWVPSRPVDAHKWRAAVWVIGGSRGMAGAAHLAARGAQRAGAGYVRLSMPAMNVDGGAPLEVVSVGLPAAPWSDVVLAGLDRVHAVVVGPGLGRADSTGESVRALVRAAAIPLVIDGDGLVALAWSSEGAAAVLRDREQPTVLTPHDGEFAVLRGARVGPDRVEAARHLARDLGVVLLLKGPTTVVAAPSGQVLVVSAGDARLATAGTGDVLSGVIGALLARRVPAFEAAAAGAWLHGRAARYGASDGFVAGDLPDLLPRAFADAFGR